MTPLAGAPDLSGSGQTIGEGLRRARDGDLPNVLRIERSSFTAPWPRSAFEMARSAPELLFLVALADNEAVGYLVAARGGGTVLIANLAVETPHRGAGRGGDLIDSAIAWARISGATRCRLEVRVSNRGAVDLYQSRGFRPVAVQADYYSSPVEDALTMLLPLTEETGL